VARLTIFTGERDAIRQVATKSPTEEMSADRGPPAKTRVKEGFDADEPAAGGMRDEGYVGRSAEPGEPAKPAAVAPADPADLPPGARAPAPEAEPAPAPAADTGATTVRRAAAADRKYAVRGAEPDTAAGVVLAELRRKRSREAAGEDPAGEKVVQGRGGVVSGMLLYLTPNEIEFVTCLLEERPGVEIARLNGRPVGKAKKADASREAPEQVEEEKDAGDDGARAPERLRVEFRFR
jgi:hypothetical protein